jgi:hypothetical protein
VSRNGPAAVERVIALGASNLTRGFHTVVSTARVAWGPRVEVLAALGHGRSYGADSQFIVRRLPGILESGLWRELNRLPPATSRALVTDVGNDIVYGFPAGQILAWVDEAIDRLHQFTKDIVLTDLPLMTIRHLSTRKYLFFRSLFVPRCRMSLAEVVDTAEKVNEGLATIASVRRLRFVTLNPEWYGFDPIHMRVSAWQTAWQHILCSEMSHAPVKGPVMEGLRLYCMFAERQSMFGIERVSPQAGVPLKRGARVWLF